MPSKTAEAGKDGFAGCERVTLDLRIEKILDEDAEYGGPQKGESDLACDVGKDYELAGPEAHTCSHDAGTNDPSKGGWRRRQLSRLKIGKSLTPPKWAPLGNVNSGQTHDRCPRVVAKHLRAAPLGCSSQRALSTHSRHEGLRTQFVQWFIEAENHIVTLTGEIANGP